MAAHDTNLTFTPMTGHSPNYAEKANVQLVSAQCTSALSILKTGID
jgi:hypothetical protein